MGGTSTDVSRYAGALEHVHEATTAGVTIQAPQLGDLFYIYAKWSFEPFRNICFFYFVYT